MAEPRQSEFRKRHRYVVSVSGATEKVHRAAIEQLKDEYWTFAVSVLDDQSHGEVWRVEAYDGFDEAVNAEGPEWADVQLVEESIGPSWHRALNGGGRCA